MSVADRCRQCSDPGNAGYQVVLVLEDPVRLLNENSAETLQLHDPVGLANPAQYRDVSACRSSVLD